MNDEKKWWQSKTVWGGLAAGGAAVAALFGLEVSTEDQVSLVAIGVQGAGLIGAALAIFGRIVASKKIH